MACDEFSADIFSGQTITALSHILPIQMTVDKMRTGKCHGAVSVGQSVFQSPVPKGIAQIVRT